MEPADQTVQEPGFSYPPRVSTASRRSAVDAGTVRVEHPDRFEVHDIALVTRSGELFQVKGIDEGVLTVRRGLGGEPHPIRKGDEIFIIGTTREDL